jgi:hypothetical protein
MCTKFSSRRNFLMEIQNLQTHACEWLPLLKFLCENMPLPIPLLLSYNLVKLQQIVRSVHESSGQVILSILLQNSIKEIN